MLICKLSFEEINLTYLTMENDIEEDIIIRYVLIMNYDEIKTISKENFLLNQE